MEDAELIALVTFISPFRADWAMARSLFKQGQFIEIFVDTPLDVSEQRELKGLYTKARREKIETFAGLGSP